MKVIIAGSREFSLADGCPLVVKAVYDSGFHPFMTELVHGGCRGIDACADWIFRRRLPIKVFPALWNEHGKSAGPIRNAQMADYADALIAVWNGNEKSGTSNMIKQALKAGLKVSIYRYD